MTTLLTSINAGICLMQKVGFKLCVLSANIDYVKYYNSTLASHVFSFHLK